MASTLTRPDVVVFDLGRVLLDFDFARASKAIAAKGRLDEKAVLKLLDQTPLLHRFETGLIRSENFYAEIVRLTGYRDTFAAFAEDYGAIFWEIHEMIAWQQQLRKQKIRTYIFSNTSELHIRYVRKTYDFFSGFSGYVFSFEEKCMKPNPGVYDVVERVTNCRRSQILYIDDRKENIDTGESRGWQTLWHRSSEETLGQGNQILTANR